MNNSFGQIFRITTFGESHGPVIGVVVDGCPAGITMDHDLMKNEMVSRRPGQSNLTTTRNETDEVGVMSGVYNNITTGAPIALLITNRDQKPSDYDEMKNVYRPSHSDYAWEKKYGIRDHRGGGRASARETAARVAAGCIAQMMLSHYGIIINAYVSQVGEIMLNKEYKQLDFTAIETTPVRCPDIETANRMIQLIESVKSEGDTIGGTVTCIAQNIPTGLGEPVYNKLHAKLAYAMLSINAAHGFDYGAGFNAIDKRGSEQNDQFVTDKGKVTTKTNYSGGIQGGISNGSDIYFRVLFKPVSTLMKEQDTVNISPENVKITASGRHDPCVLPRAVAVVKAMTAIVLADSMLLHRSSVI
jgi:chorismate synthase